MTCSADLIIRAEEAIADLLTTARPCEATIHRVNHLAMCLSAGLHYPDHNPTYKPSDDVEKEQYQKLYKMACGQVTRIRYAMEYERRTLLAKNNLQLIEKLFTKPMDLDSVRNLVQCTQGQTVDDVIDELADARMLHLDGDDGRNPVLELTMDGFATFRDITRDAQRNLMQR